ncbi:MAG: glycosyltransferase family 4 protein, partial [Planctomycetota bacterium]
CVAVSEHEKRILESYGARTALVPNGVDCAECEPFASRRPENRASLYFCGSLDAFCNQDALRYFLESCWKLIKAEMPEALFSIIGSKPPPWVRATPQRYPGVRLVPDSVDVRAEIAKANICVVPLRVGGGTRLKVLEAAALERPVVSTPVGCEDLGMEDGRELLVANTPREMAAAVARLARDQALADRIAGEAAKFVRERYDWSIPAARQRDAWLRVILDQRRGGRGGAPCDAYCF